MKPSVAVEVRHGSKKRQRRRCCPRPQALLGCFFAITGLLVNFAAVAQAAPAAPSSADLSIPPQQWAAAAAALEEHVVNYDPGQPLCYRVRRIDAKGEVVREVIDSNDGPVARLLLHDGQPLTTAEDAAERERLQSLLTDPTPLIRHGHHEAGSRAYATELLRAMPHAMMWRYTPGQPQIPGAASPAVVLDFQPDPRFQPPSLITEGLTGVAGRVWVDTADHVVTAIEGHVLRPVDFGWGGMLARVRSGGTIRLTQRKAPNGRWLYSRLTEHLTIREAFVHTAEENVDSTISEVQSLAHPVPYQVAIGMLLAIPVPTR